MWGLLHRLQQQIKSNHSINHSAWLISRGPDDFLFSLPSSLPPTFAPLPSFPISLQMHWFFRKLAIFLPFFYLEIEKSGKEKFFFFFPMYCCNWTYMGGPICNYSLMYWKQEVKITGYYYPLLMTFVKLPVEAIWKYFSLLATPKMTVFQAVSRSV